MRLLAAHPEGQRRFYRFADDLKVSDDGVLSLLVLLERFEII